MKKIFLCLAATGVVFAIVAFCIWLCIASHGSLLLVIPTAMVFYFFYDTYDECLAKLNKKS